MSHELCDSGSKDGWRFILQGSHKACIHFIMQKHNGYGNNFQDLTGQRFGRLVVVRRIPNLGRFSRWECHCECGSVKDAASHKLKDGSVRSCGCLRRETITKHGMSPSGARTPEYRTWKAMKARCNNPNYPFFSDYGGRGIKICERWHKFECFYADMGTRPSKAYSIERIFNDGNYEPSNCRWATSKEQNRNRRDTILVEWEGKKRALAELAELYGISHSTASKRLKAGWCLVDVLTRPLLKRSLRSHQIKDANT